MAGKEQSSTKPMMQNKNVAGGQLRLFSKDPPTGFYRDGFCRTGPEDEGNHSVAAEMTEDFLDHSASKGNNLKDVGVKPGMKWCLCAHRWGEAYDAWKDGKLSKEAVPKVFLHATHEKATEKVSYSSLKEFASQSETPSQTGRQDSHHSADSGGGLAKEHNSLGGDFGSSAPSKKYGSQ